MVKQLHQIIEQVFQSDRRRSRANPARWRQDRQVVDHIAHHFESGGAGADDNSRPQFGDRYGGFPQNVGGDLPGAQMIRLFGFCRAQRSCWPAARSFEPRRRAAPRPPGPGCGDGVRSCPPAGPFHRGRRSAEHPPGPPPRRSPPPPPCPDARSPHPRPSRAPDNKRYPPAPAGRKAPAAG